MPGIRSQVLSPQFLLRKLVPDSQSWFPEAQFLFDNWFQNLNPGFQKLSSCSTTGSRISILVSSNSVPVQQLVPDSKSWFPVTSIAIVCSMVDPASRTVADLYARIGTQKLSPVSFDGLRNSSVYGFRHLN